MTKQTISAAIDSTAPYPTQTDGVPAEYGVSRRGFLGRAGAVTAAAVTVGTLGGLPRPTIVAASRSRAAARNQLTGEGRADQALAIRLGAARKLRARKLPLHIDNGDEAAYANRQGSYTKGLPHNAQGDVDPAAYEALLTALASGNGADFDAIPMGGKGKFADPMSAYAFTLDGPDSASLATPPAPAFSSAEEAGEMAELYWQALAHDIPFAAYATDRLVGKAAADLSRLSDFRGPKANGTVSPVTVFRAGLTGELTGPYLSQFLVLPIAYGAMKVPQLYPVAPANEYLTTFADWLIAQQGQYSPPAPSSTPASPLPTRYLSTGRDLATYLHADFTYQAYLNAGLILYKMSAPLDAGNPYLHSKNQAGVGTFGPHHLYDLVAKAANAAVKTSWYHKWLVHRRVRPESFGGRVHKQKMGVAQAPIHADLLTTSSVLAAVQQQTGSYLLPMPYAEGAPLHPSYPAAHTTITGACVTILKAFFDESAVLASPMVPTADGSTLALYTGPDLTVGGELNKLAGNLAMGRAFGGSHWRSDNIVGLQLGEAVAIGLLADEAQTYPELFKGFSLTKFDGTTITV